MGVCYDGLVRRSGVMIGCYGGCYGGRV